MLSLIHLFNNHVSYLQLCMYINEVIQLCILLASNSAELSRAIIQNHKDGKPHQHDRQIALQTSMLRTYAQPQQHEFFLHSASGCCITSVLQG